jgi:hypothetical protein
MLWGVASQPPERFRAVDDRHPSDTRFVPAWPVDGKTGPTIPQQIEIQSNPIYFGLDRRLCLTESEALPKIIR